MSKRKRTAERVTADNITWPAFDLAELWAWADNQLADVVQWPEIAIEWPEVSIEWPELGDVVQVGAIEQGTP